MWVKKTLYGLKRLGGNFLLSLAFCSMLSNNATAQTLHLISDEETEQFIADIVQPLFKAAKLNFNRNNIYIVDDNSLNAFVADGNNLFIHTGTLMSADSAGEIAGVIAHETGHIEGGHILRQKIKNKAMQEVSLASLILAGTAAAASGRADVGMAVLLGSQSSALTHYTRYRTEEERSADEAAIKLLKATNQSPAGILEFMKRINHQNTLNGIEETPYFRTHPVTRERIGFFEENLKNSTASGDNKSEDEFARVKAKLTAYLNEPAKTLQKYPLSNHSAAARYAHAITFFKQMKFTKAQSELDKLIAQEPNNPYFHELKGQIFLETGKIKEARAAYQKALSLRPHSSLLQIDVAQAIIEDNPSPADLKQAINLLNKAIIKRPAAYAWLLLSRAYGMNQQEDYANYAAAEYSLRIGALDAAQKQAEQAKKQNPSPQLALKIDDILDRIKDLKK